MEFTMPGPSQRPSATTANGDSNPPRPSFSRSVKRYFSSSAKGTSASSARQSSQISDSGFSAATSSSVPPAHEDSQAATARLMAVWDAQDYIKAFIDERWSDRAAHIQADCNITLDELHALGRLPRAEGSLACRRLVRAPAIHEEVALSLWEHLAAEALRNPFESAAEGDDSSDGASSIRSTSTSVNSRASKTESARGFFKKVTARHRHQEDQPHPPPRAHEEHSTPVPACPFCSHSCLSSSASSRSSSESQQEEEDQWEDGFWQREDPPRHPPPSAAGDDAQPVSPPEVTVNGGSSGSKRKGKRAWLRGKKRGQETSRTEKKDGPSRWDTFSQRSRVTWDTCRDVVALVKGDNWYM